MYWNKFYIIVTPQYNIWENYSRAIVLRPSPWRQCILICRPVLPDNASMYVYTLCAGELNFSSESRTPSRLVCEINLIKSGICKCIAIVWLHTRCRECVYKFTQYHTCIYTLTSGNSPRPEYPARTIEGNNSPRIWQNILSNLLREGTLHVYIVLHQDVTRCERGVLRWRKLVSLFSTHHYYLGRLLSVRRWNEYFITVNKSQS